MRRSKLIWTVPILLHQGGWDEALLIFGLPVALFALLRWLAGRRRDDESDNGHDG